MNWAIINGILAQLKSLSASWVTSGRFGKGRLEWTADKLLKGAGAGADPTEINPYDIFGQFIEFIPWVSLDGFTTGGDAGFTVTVDGAGVELKPNNAAGEDAFIFSKGNWQELLDAGKVVTCEFLLHWMQSVADITVWFRLGNPTADPPGETAQHFGFKLINADLYASNADGANQTITDTTVDITATLQRTRCKIVFTPGTDIKFYVNDVLKATHDTNLPTVDYYNLHIHVRTGADAFKKVLFGRFLLQKEHA